MSQKTNLNISPYYDDFDKNKDFYKVLFNPGKPVQTRELTTLQSILQNQVESLANYSFKEGSMVLPGALTYDNQFSAVKLNATNLGVDISIYINNLIGKTITGLTSGVTASVQFVALTSDSDIVENLTIYVKYLNSGTDSVTSIFLDGESLFANDNVIYGNTTIPSGTPFASLISLNATSVGSAISIDNGVYFLRGVLANVRKQTIILDYYTNTPSYRVGFQVNESIVDAKEDESLYDNAKGFTNFAAPGADRFKIELPLVKKLLDDTSDSNFVEIFRVVNGKVKIIENKKDTSNTLRDYLAERTFDESGHYLIDDFNINLVDSLNNRIDSDGLYLENELTEQGNVPSDDLMCVQVSPGKAYVAGYDVELSSSYAIDIDKPRTTQTVNSQKIPFQMGNLLRVNNVEGALKENEKINLVSEFKAESGISTIGQARVYSFNLTDSAYSNESTSWDLYLYDVQTYTNITFNRSVTASEIPTSSYIQGRSSGASGYVVSSGSTTNFNLSQTSGTFSQGEQLSVNGVDFPLTVSDSVVYGIKDIKSVSQSGISGFASFSANSILDTKNFSNGISEVNISSGTVTSPGKLFSGVNIGDIVQVIEGGNLKYNKIDTISSDLSSFTISGITTVAGVFDGGLIGNGNYNAQLKIPELKNNENAFLYAKLLEDDISSVNLSSSELTISQQITGESIDVSGTLTFNLSSISGIDNASFEVFDQERYSVHYADGGIGTITSDRFSVDFNTDTVTIIGLSTSQSNVVVNTTLKKNNIQSKIKEYQKSAVKIVNLSRLVRSGAATSDSINDGLTYNPYYGLRVQDDEISLDVPDVSEVIAVYESTNTSDPVLDKIEFSSISNVDSNAIIGEKIIGSDSGAVARVVLNSSSTPSVPVNNIGIVYLNDETFSLEEDVTFSDSNIVSNIKKITAGSYKNITDIFSLDKGQKSQYYDYSRIIRNNRSVPERKLLIVYDYYKVPSSDNGDVFTVLSYDSDRFSDDVPTIGTQNDRASDVLDFRPRVQNFDVSTATSSPFAFESRVFNSNSIKYNLKPNESSTIGYSFYLPRIDKVYLDKFGNLIVDKGIPSKDPIAPLNGDETLMDLAEITLPSYLYNIEDANISISDNRRYTMRDIGDLEERIESVERLTSLSLLEINTESLRIEDSDGNNRFKSGFFVDDFNDITLSDENLTNATISDGVLRPRIISNSLQLTPIPATEIAEDKLDLSENFELLDPNVQKTGNVITLKYNSVGWIEQKLATRVENVNPFNVIEYTGSITLLPSSDNWTRTISLPTLTFNRFSSYRGRWRYSYFEYRHYRTNYRYGYYRYRYYRPYYYYYRRPYYSYYSYYRYGSYYYYPYGRYRYYSRYRRRYLYYYPFYRPITRNIIVSSVAEKYIRSRNVSFFGESFKPFTRHYAFFDSHSNIDIIPKLVEISNSNTLESFGSRRSSFSVGETINVYFANKKIGRFRLASSNHRSGIFNSPDKIYTNNPYFREESIPSSYSQSSKTINIDLVSLSTESQGNFFGYLKTGAKIVGQSSKAIAYVKDLRLVSDVDGTLFGSFFIKDPYSSIVPNLRISTGKKTFKLTSSKNNTIEISESSSNSFGNTTYTAEGTIQSRRTSVTAVRRDPLAQSFTVGKDIQAPNFNGQNDDDNGAYLTAVDIFVANKPTGNEPLIVEIRTVELGTPTLTLLGEPVTLYPEDINISSNGEIATTVTFNYPIFLAPGKEYALVLLAPTSDKYEVWTAKIGEDTVNPNTSGSTRYTKQFAVGSLFKSQNGSIWTPEQESDLKFKLYKAQFTSNTGIAFFGNPPLGESNDYIKILETNAINTFPKAAVIGITTVPTGNSLIDILSPGRKIFGSIEGSSANIISTGCSVSAVTIDNGGENYQGQTDVSTKPIVGNGSGLKLNFSVSGVGTINSVTITDPGFGYAVGDIVSIDNSDGSFTGVGGVITISEIAGIDTLYVTNVQGELGSGKAFEVGIGLSYADTESTIVSLGSTVITRLIEGTGVESGNYLQVNHFNHGMFANNNKLKIYDVESDVSPTILTETLLSTNTTSIQVEDSSIFETFEGFAVDGSNLGYVKIGDEIISYNSVTSNQLSIQSRGVEGVIQDHDINSSISKYEFVGMSLRRINGVTYDISDVIISADQYFIEIDRSSNGLNRSSDSTLPQVSFSSQIQGGGSQIRATENLTYNRLTPKFDINSPGKETSVTGVIRTTTATSIDGSETSFELLNEVEPISLDGNNELSSFRMICSRVNELNQNAFDNVSGRRSFTSALTLSTTDENLSPIIFLNDSTVEFSSDFLNAPVDNFELSSLVGSSQNDPHAAIYVSNVTTLSKPASSLKVILTAYRPFSSDIRVLYNLVRDDSSEVPQEFELFPGFENLKSSSDGDLEVIDPVLNNGREDIEVPASSDGQFLQYEFTANDLPDFSGFAIKIIMAGTDQSNAPIIRDLRAIAVKWKN